MKNKKLSRLLSLIAAFSVLLTAFAGISVSAEAPTAISYIINEDFNSGSNTTHFGAGHGFTDFSDGHGKAAQLYASTSQVYNTSAENLATAPKDQVFSFDIYLAQTDTRYDVIAYDDAEKTQVHMVFYSNGVMCYNHKALTMDDPTAYNAIQINKVNKEYDINRWHNVTIYFDYRDSAADATAGNSYVFLDGVRIKTAAMANFSKGINKISFTTPKVTNATGKRAFVDNVKLHYIEDNSFCGVVEQSNGNIIVNLSEPLGDGADATVDYTGTTLTNKYTGEDIGATILSSSRNQLVIKPGQTLKQGTEYAVTLPETLLRWTGNGGTGTTPVAQPSKQINNVIEFTPWDNDKVVMSEDGTNSTANGVFKTFRNVTGITTETDATKGALKIDYTYSDATDGWIQFNNANEKNGVIGINYAKSDKIIASLDFMVPEVAYYGTIDFAMNSAWNAECTDIASFLISSDGTIKCFPSRQKDSVSSTYTGTYKANEWNNLAVEFDTETNEIRCFINGRLIRKDKKVSYTTAPTLMSVNYSARSAADDTTTMYIDNINVTESYTGVSGVKVGSNGNVWTKGEIAAVGTDTIEVTFDDTLRDGFEFNNNNIRLYGGGNAELIKTWTADGNKVTLELNDELLSNTEYTLAVWNVKDRFDKTITPYESKFTTKPLEISDLKIVGGDDTEIVASTLKVDDKVYALPTVDGRKEAVVIVAQYNGGKLTNITPVKTTLETGMTQKAELTILEAEGDLMLKAFVWDSLENLNPLCNVKTY